MGHSSWNPTSYSARSAFMAGKSVDDLYRQPSVQDHFKADNITVRESCDSEAHPNSLPILVGLDVSASMGFVSAQMIRDSLGPIMNHAIGAFPFDPHIGFLAIGDALCDSKPPLQATQFEADDSIVDQMTGLHLTGQGGGNSFESYDLAWAFATHKTSIDSVNIRQKKGYLITIGDENPPAQLATDYYQRVFGKTYQRPEDVLAAAQKNWNVFHITTMEGSYASAQPNSVTTKWRDLLGNRALFLKNHKNLHVVILQLIALSEEVNFSTDQLTQSEKGTLADTFQHV